MATPTPARTRNERRAAHAPTIEALALSLPTRTRPHGKTLLQQAAERQAALDRAAGRRVRAPESAPGASPLADALLYALSLAAVHLTLDVLAHRQYRQELDWRHVSTRAAAALPLLVLLVYALRPTRGGRVLGGVVPRQAVFFAVAVAAGCRLVYAGNRHGYFAVMKRAPALGTLWVWGVVEMRVGYGVVSLVAVGLYAWWNGLGVF